MKTLLGLFTAEMENQLYEVQKKVWKMLRKRKQETNVRVQTQTAPEQTWNEYLTNVL